MKTVVWFEWKNNLGPPFYFPPLILTFPLCSSLYFPCLIVLSRQDSLGH